MATNRLPDPTAVQPTPVTYAPRQYATGVVTDPSQLQTYAGQAAQDNREFVPFYAFAPFNLPDVRRTDTSQLTLTEIALSKKLKGAAREHLTAVQREANTALSAAMAQSFGRALPQLISGVRLESRGPNYEAMAFDAAVRANDMRTTLPSTLQGIDATAQQRIAGIEYDANRDYDQRRFARDTAQVQENARSQASNLTLNQQALQIQNDITRYNTIERPMLQTQADNQYASTMFDRWRGEQSVAQGWAQVDLARERATRDELEFAMKLQKAGQLPTVMTGLMSQLGVAEGQRGSWLPFGLGDTQGYRMARQSFDAVKPQAKQYLNELRREWSELPPQRQQALRGVYDTLFQTLSTLEAGDSGEAIRRFNDGFGGAFDAVITTPSGSARPGGTSADRIDAGIDDALGNNATQIDFRGYGVEPNPSQAPTMQSSNPRVQWAIANVYNPRAGGIAPTGGREKSWDELNQAGRGPQQAAAIRLRLENERAELQGAIPEFQRLASDTTLSPQQRYYYEKHRVQAQQRLGEVVEQLQMRQ